MLRKLLKHEFRATARIMGPLFLIVLVLALGGNLSFRFMVDTDSFVSNLLGVLLMTAFVVGMIVLACMSIVVMVNRFRTNLMGDEGYLMFTLPASSHQLVWSKIIVSSVWFIATTVVEILAGLICAFNLDVFREIFDARFFQELTQVIQYVVQEYGLNIPMIILESIVITLLSCAVLCLQFYAAMAVGYSFANHKVALSVLAFFAMQFVTQFICGIAINAVGNQAWAQMFDRMENMMPAFHIMMGIGIVSTLVMGAAYYAVTAVMLKKRLNLQ